MQAELAGLIAGGIMVIMRRNDQVAETPVSEGTLYSWKKANLGQHLGHSRKKGSQSSEQSLRTAFRFKAEVSSKW